MCYNTQVTDHLSISWKGGENMSFQMVAAAAMVIATMYRLGVCFTELFYDKLNR